MNWDLGFLTCDWVAVGVFPLKHRLTADSTLAVVCAVAINTSLVALFTKCVGVPAHDDVSNVGETDGAVAHRELGLRLVARVG